MKRFFRGATIVWVVLRYGLDELVLTSFQKPWLRLLARIVSVGRDLRAPRGVRLREALERLGPIFVKFGQVLSTRRDLMPPDIADELAHLQDRVPPFDSVVAVATIERAFRRPLAEVFESFERVPVASASIAQVHFATLRDRHGALHQVAVKVLRPGMLPVIEKDLSLMRMMAGWVESLSADGKRLKPREVVAEFDNYLHDELDLVREAANAAQLRRNMEGLNLVEVPIIHWDFCHPEVMVMERMNGVPISQVQRLRDAGVDIPKLARDGVTIFFTQVFRDGFFHADMHPGNIQVSLDPATFGRYISLDFGIVGTLTESDKEYLAQNFAAFFRRDYKRVAELHIESGWVPPGTRINELEGAIRTVCSTSRDWAASSIPTWTCGARPSRFWKSGCSNSSGPSVSNVSCKPRPRTTPRSYPRCPDCCTISCSTHRDSSTTVSCWSCSGSSGIPTVCCKAWSTSALALCWA